MSTWYFFGRSTEPEQDGKSLTEWLVIASHPLTGKQDTAVADKAIQRIGSNAVPTLLEKLTAEDPFWLPIAKPWNWVIDQTAPSEWYPNLGINEWRTFEKHRQALHGFSVIGTNGSAAIPRLVTLLHDDRFDSDAAEALASIRTEQALAALATGLTNADASTRSISLSYLRSIAYDFGATSLVQWAEQIAAMRLDPNEEVATEAALLIPIVIPEERAVPMLLELLRAPNPTLQARALRLLSTGPESVMEPIAHCIPSLAPTNRVSATNALILLNVYRAPEFGVNTNGLNEAQFVIQNRRQGERRTNSISPLPRGARPRR